ncbi:MAG TPA: hypothetical protein DD490_01325, partial [Acidobacteria bacterium]|nr:hypothetical protein [Acidobacteriota bacterium]
MLLRRSAVFVLCLALSSLSGVPLSAEEPSAAVERLKATVAALDPARDAAALGDAWLQLGLAYLKGMGNAQEALPAFLASAAVAPDPSSAWLWASVTAEALGRTAEAAAYRTRAVSPP